MAKFTDREEIEVALRYIRRVRAMQPSAAAMKDLDRQEEELNRKLRHLNESGAPTSGSISLSSNPGRHQRAGF